MFFYNRNIKTNMNSQLGDDVFRYTIVVFCDTKSTTRYLEPFCSILNYLWDQIIINNKSQIFFCYFLQSKNYFLLLKTKTYLSLLSLYLQKTTKSYHNFLKKCLKNQYARTNIKQKNRIKIRETSIGISQTKSCRRQQIILIYSNEDINAKKYKG